MRLTKSQKYIAKNLWNTVGDLEGIVAYLKSAEGKGLSKKHWQQIVFVIVNIEQAVTKIDYVITDLEES